ncbi:MAG TPA: hypothetical protein VFM79_01580 [Pelobium sp.]|nr:hypothetical protein [Pelobium sp.]
MNRILALLILTLVSFGLKAQNLIGAWERDHTSETGVKLKSVIIFSDGYHALSTYEAITGKFISTSGGSWELKGNTLKQTIEFHTDEPELVGKKISFEVNITDSTFKFVDHRMQFERIDNGTPGKLQGAWLMAGRVTDGKEQLRNTDTPRKTMKIMSGKRFQWIAYHTETKEFMGTGGGTYTTIDKKYTENIEFFSKDNTRVGASLQFDYDLVDGKWHHKGLSSKGNPIHEIWAERK